MPFPITVQDQIFETGPALVQGILADAEAGGGSVVPDQTPDAWLAVLHENEALSPAEAQGLCAALIGSGHPGGICVGARLGARLDLRPIGRLVITALADLSLGTLLQLDPMADGASVEDTLLHAATDLIDAADPAQRAPLLTRLRNAGLPELEIRILARHGSLDEIELWLAPALRDATDEHLRPLEQGLKRQDVGPAIQEALTRSGRDIP